VVLPYGNVFDYRPPVLAGTKLITNLTTNTQEH